jgi:hypothetical protein
MTATTLTQERLKALLHYDPETGVFQWVGRKHGRARSKTEAGCVEKRIGYATIGIDGKVYKSHRLAWLYVYGVWPTGIIDHINHKKADNRIVNLRDVTDAQNHQNRARNTRSASGHLGVTWHSRDAQWMAHIEAGRKRHHLGYFKNLDDAIAARKAAERVHHPDRPL